MITQAFKRWLDKLFSWWPWKRSSRSNFSQPVNHLNLSSAQDSPWNTLPEGAVPQPGITSVVVEQERDNDPLATEGPISATSRALAEPTNSGLDQASSMSTFEQKLHFLRYLVHQGIVNEGFVEDHTPRQYKRKE
jgi:hypothetical protein